MIRTADTADAAAICRIYNHYILQTVITFEEEPVGTEDMAQRIARVTAAGLPWLVLEEDGVVAGYAYAAPWKQRSAYRYAVESTVYLDAAATGRGYGSLLYSALLAALRATPVHTVVACIALPNEASVALHEKHGFRQAGHFTDAGRKFDRWIDVGYWQLLL